MRLLKGEGGGERVARVGFERGKERGRGHRGKGSEPLKGCCKGEEGGGGGRLGNRSQGARQMREYERTGS